MPKSLSQTLRGTNYGTLPVSNGGTGATTSTGTTNLVLSNGPTLDSPRITTVALIGPSTAANLTRFPNSLTAISNTASGIQKNEGHNIGLVAEGTAHATDTSIYGIGVYGKGYTNAATRSGGVVGEGHVSATGDTGSAIGVRGYANDTHAGGMNIGLYGDAAGGATNYALYMNSGNITNVAAQTWTLGGNLTFGGAYSVTIPTLSLTNALTVANGGTGLTSPGTAGYILTSNGTAWVSQAAPVSLPSQTGNANKYLKTDGATASWTAIASTLQVLNRSVSFIGVTIQSGILSVLNRSGSTISVGVS
jgi:hypothetical protein